jgi:hypothetical protein
MLRLALEGYLEPSDRLSRKVVVTTRLGWALLRSDSESLFLAHDLLLHLSS